VRSARTDGDDALNSWGNHYHIDATKRHDARNTGTGPAKVLAIYLIEKGKPLAVAAP